MKKFIIAAAFIMGATVANADPIEGVWQTEPDEGKFAHVTIAPCGGAFCGTISRTFEGENEVQSANTGKQIVIDMQPSGSGSYEGKVWRPANNKIYNGKISLSGNQMKLSGCVAGGLLCKSQSWVKVQ